MGGLPGRQGFLSTGVEEVKAKGKKAIALSIVLIVQVPLHLQAMCPLMQMNHQQGHLRVRLQL